MSDEVMSVPYGIITMLVVIAMVIIMILVVRSYTDNAKPDDSALLLKLTSPGNSNITCVDYSLIPAMTGLKHYVYTVSINGYKVNFIKEKKVQPVLFYKGLAAGDPAVTQGIDVGPGKANTFTNTFEVESTEMYRKPTENESVVIGFFEFTQECYDLSISSPKKTRNYFMTKCAKSKSFLGVVQIDIQTPNGCTAPTLGTDYKVCYYNPIEICLAIKDPVKDPGCYWNGRECDYCSAMDQSRRQTCAGLSNYECKCGTTSGKQCYWTRTEYECVDCTSSEHVPKCSDFDRETCIMNPCNLDCYYDSANKNCKTCPGTPPTEFHCSDYTDDGRYLCIAGACGKHCSWNDASSDCGDARP